MPSPFFTGTAPRSEKVSPSPPSIWRKAWSLTRYSPFSRRKTSGLCSARRDTSPLPVRFTSCTLTKFRIKENAVRQIFRLFYSVFVIVRFLQAEAFYPASIENKTHAACDDLRYRKGRHKLADHGSDRRSGHSHFRKRPPTEDQKWIKNDVCHSSRNLGRHRNPHVSACLMHLRKNALKENSQVFHADDEP